jgi:hypothetical protein
VRELENAIERAVVVCRNDEIGVSDLPPEVAGSERRAGDAPVVPGATLEEVERHTILSTLEHTGGSTSRAADILGVSVRTIQNRLRRYMLTSPARRRLSPRQTSWRSAATTTIRRLIAIANAGRPGAPSAQDVRETAGMRRPPRNGACFPHSEEAPT